MRERGRGRGRGKEGEVDGKARYRKTGTVL